MSDEVHVGDCPLMTFTRRWEDGAVIADRPWERFAVIDDELLPYLAAEDGTVRFDMANGWARYRLVGRAAEGLFVQMRSVWEYVEGEWAEP